jgi:hypothetical protein
VIAFADRARTAPASASGPRRLVRAWERLRRPADAALGLRVAWWLSVAAVLLRLLPPRTALRLIAGRCRRGSVDWRRVERIRTMVDAWIGVWPFRGHGRCLRRSLVLYRLLRGEGLEVSVELGVRQVGGRVAGHSWLTWRGQPVFERVDPGQDFVRMAEWS